MENNVPKGCLPFDLEAAKNGAKVVTRDGREAKYIHLKNRRPLFKFTFIVDGGQESYDSDGRYLSNNTDSLYDLFLVDPNCMGTESPQEQPYEVTMVATSPKNTEFEFKQEIAAQFVLSLLKLPEYKSSNPSRAVIGGLDNYQIFLEKFKERFSITQAPE